MFTCMYVCMYVCVLQSAEPEDNSRSEKLSELFEERSKWMLLARQVRLLLHIHTNIHTYIHEYHYTFNNNLVCSTYIPTDINAYIHAYFLDQSELACLQRLGHPPSAPAICKAKRRKNAGAESSSHGAEVVHTSQPDTMDHTHTYILDSVNMHIYIHAN